METKCRMSYITKLSLIPTIIELLNGDVEDLHIDPIINYKKTNGKSKSDPMKYPASIKMLELLRSSPTGTLWSLDALEAKTKFPRGTVSSSLNHLKVAGLAKNVGRGTWSLA